MGQQQCLSQKNQEVTDGNNEFLRLGTLLIRSSNSKSKSFLELTEEESVQSYCRQVGIGKYMSIPESKVLVKHWNSLISMTNIPEDESQKSMSRLSQDEKQLLQEAIEQKKEVRKKYVFIDSNRDLILLLLYIMDRKGMKLLLQIGPPSKFRWSTWKVSLLFIHRDIIKNLIYEDEISQVCQSEYNIKKDVTRTFTNHLFFLDNQMNQFFGQAQLERVLKAIANTYPNLGYCQGMNFLVGFLLMISGCDENSTFKVMMILLTSPKYLLYFIYSPELPLLFMIQYFIKRQMQIKLPKLYGHLYENLETPESFWVTKIILSIFLFSFDIQYCARFWDYFLARGSIKGFVELTMSLMEQIQKELLESTNIEIVNIFSGQIKPKNMLQMDEMILNAYKTFKLTKKDIQKFTLEYIQETDNQDNFIKCLTEYTNKNKFNLSVVKLIQKQELTKSDSTRFE